MSYSLKKQTINQPTLPAKGLPKVVGLGENLHVPVYPKPGTTVSTNKRHAVFLDRDGVIIEDVHFLQESAQIRILPGVIEALHQLQTQYYIIVITNQSGVARGLISEDGLLQIHTTLVQRLYADGVSVDGLYYCPHLPNAPVAAYDLECSCRKPKPGMLLQAEKDRGIDLPGSFLVGDRPTDIKAAQAGGVTGILVGANRTEYSQKSIIAQDLAEAATLILSTSKTSGSHI